MNISQLRLIFAVLACVVVAIIYFTIKPERFKNEKIWRNIIAVSFLIPTVLSLYLVFTGK
jgi:glycopeptide antibiotics resistance protein